MRLGHFDLLNYVDCNANTNIMILFKTLCFIKNILKHQTIKFGADDIT